MSRIMVLGIALVGSVALAAPPMESVPRPVSVYPAVTTEPPPAAAPAVLDGTKVPACPTVCDNPCPEPGRLPLFARRPAEPKTVCCDAPPALESVLARVLPVTPCVPQTCNVCPSTSEKCGTPMFRGLRTRTTTCEVPAACPKEPACDQTAVCADACRGSGWTRIKAWMSYRSCPGPCLPCTTPNAYQPSLFAYVPCRNETLKGCASCGTGGCEAGPRCRTVPTLGLFDRIVASFGLGRRECTGDGSHRVCPGGRHGNYVRDCTGAEEMAGTQLIPGFRFAAAEQIRLYGQTHPALPVAQPHWPVPAAEPEKAPDAKPKVEKPMAEKPVDPKKQQSPTGLSVNRPFTNP